MQRKVPMMVIGQTPHGSKAIKLVEVGVSRVEYSQKVHYHEALRIAFDSGDVMGPMVALAPEDVLLLTDGIATMKQCLMGDQGVVSIKSRQQSAAGTNFAKTA